MMMTSKTCQIGDEDYNYCNKILNFAAYIVDSVIVIALLQNQYKNHIMDVTY